MQKVELHAKQIFSAVERGEAARSALVASWSRCAQSYGLHPTEERPHRVLTAQELNIAVERMEPVTAVGKPILERLSQSFEASEACVLLAGTDGIPVQWLGRQNDADDLRRAGLWTGVDWSEQAEGTNGIGTCLVDKTPLSIHREEHFFARDTDISCVVAPVFDDGGLLLGALNVTLYGASIEGLIPRIALNAVVESARQIEAEYFHKLYYSCRIVSLSGQHRAGTALLAIDKDDVVVAASRTARSSFSLTDASIEKGICLAELMREADGGFEQAELGVLRRALIRTKGNVSEAARQLNVSRATFKRKVRRHGLKRK